LAGTDIGAGLEASVQNADKTAGQSSQGVVVTVPEDAGAVRLVVREVEELSASASALGVGSPNEIADRTV
jgi:hypothetical protein